MRGSLVLVAVLSFGLAACGDDDDPPERITATEVELNSINVIGTSTPLIPGSPAPISASENNGRFTIEWDTTANGVIDIELAVRENSTDYPGPCWLPEYEFHDEACGEGYDCDLVDSLSCTFGNDNRVTCDRGKGVDLSPLLDQLPKEAVITVVARMKNGTSCDYEEVEFR